MVQMQFTPSDRKANFRMRRETFIYLCEKLRQEIEPQKQIREPSPALKNESLLCFGVLPQQQNTEHLFGIGISTVCSIVQTTCQAIVHCLMPNHIQFPSEEMLSDVVEKFSKSFNFPQCGGAIDGTHIPVTPHKLNHTDYYNRKGLYSVVLQPVVDYRYLFQNIYIGWPGSVHDARVLTNSFLFKEAENEVIFRGQE